MPPLSRLLPLHLSGSGLEKPYPIYSHHHHAVMLLDFLVDLLLLPPSWIKATEVIVESYV
jgi:hypothetical protein